MTRENTCTQDELICALAKKKNDAEEWGKGILEKHPDSSKSSFELGKAWAYADVIRILQTGRIIISETTYES